MALCLEKSFASLCSCPRLPESRMMSQHLNGAFLMPVIKALSPWKYMNVPRIIPKHMTHQKWRFKKKNWNVIPGVFAFPEKAPAVMLNHAKIFSSNKLVMSGALKDLRSLLMYVSDSSCCSESCSRQKTEPMYWYHNASYI